MSHKEYVILVDEADNEIGRKEKMAAHWHGLLHRAFSIFLYRQKGDRFEILLQQREKNKYHCAGLWANTCCSHPRHGETVIEAGKRRLAEEMGIFLETSLMDIGSFLYRVEFDNGLTEHEIDHVLVTTYDADVIPFNPMEVEAVRWVSLAEIESELRDFPAHFTPWFAPALALVKEKPTP